MLQVKKKISVTALCIILVIAMTIPGCGCSQKKYSFTGVLSEASSGLITVYGNDEYKDFVINKDTSYTLDSEDTMEFGDVVTIVYHTSGRNNVADVVELIAKLEAYQEDDGSRAFDTFHQEQYQKKVDHILSHVRRAARIANLLL